MWMRVVFIICVFCLVDGLVDGYIVEQGLIVQVVFEFFDVFVDCGDC